MIYLFEAEASGKYLCFEKLDTGVVGQKRIIPVFLPLFSVYLQYLNVRTRFFGTKAKPSYVLRVLIHHLKEQYAVNVFKAFFRFFFVGLVTFKEPFDSVYQRIGVTKKTICIREQPYFFGIRSLCLQSLGKFQNSIQMIAVTRMGSIRMLWPNFTDFHETATSSTSLCETTKANSVYWKELNEISLINLNFCVDRRGRLHRTTNYDIAEYSEYPFTGVQSRDSSLIFVKQPIVEVKDNCLFLGYCHNYSNYFHFIVEILPRLLLFSQKEFAPISAILPLDSPRQISEILEVFSGKPPTLLNPLLTYRFRNLEVTFDYTHSKLVDYRDSLEGRNCFESRKGELLLSSKFLTDAFYKSPRNSAAPSIATRIFLTRKGTMKRIPTNIFDIEELLRKHNFLITDTANMSIGEQISLFRHAEVIFALSGASLTNLIFCKPGTQVIVIPDDLSSFSEVFWRDFGALFNISVLIFKFITVNKSRSYSVLLKELDKLLSSY